MPPPPAADAADVQPPPPPPPGTAGGTQPPGKRPNVALIVAIAVIAIAVVAAVAFVAFRGKHDGQPNGDRTVTPTPVATTTPTPAPSATDYLAAVTGAAGDRLGLVAGDGTVTDLTTGLGQQVFQIGWSPDATYLAAVAGSYKRPRLWLFDVAGSGTGSLVDLSTNGVVAVDSFAWLSSTRLLVAGLTSAVANTGQNAELLVYDTATRSAEPLVDAGGSALQGISVSASSDGGRIAFVTYTDQKKQGGGAVLAKEHLELFESGGKTVTQLASGVAAFGYDGHTIYEPLISPTGDAVIYRSTQGDVGTSYTVVDATGAVLMPTMRTSFPAPYSWDPTGQKVVFSGHAAAGATVTLYVFDKATGGRARALARYLHSTIQDVAWSPDGATIAVAVWDKNNYKTGNIFTLSSSGGQASPLSNDTITPAWAPNAGGAGSGTR